jgi:hypothetical protein
MVYQLPNGKVIFISIEEFLQLTEDDLQYLMAVDAGEYINSYLDSVENDTEFISDEEEITTDRISYDDSFDIPDFNEDFIE